MNKTNELSEKELELVSGGNLRHCPSNKTLKNLELNNILHCTGGFTDVYYDVWENGHWKNVGSEDMLKMVEKTIGKEDPRYVSLLDFVKSGTCSYKGENYGHSDGYGGMF